MDALERCGGHHELGFSSLGAYALERCERGRRWARESKALARRLRENELSTIRSEVYAGRLGWCMAELLARHAEPSSEVELVAQAGRKTVRQMEAWLEEQHDSAPSGPQEEDETVHCTREVGRDEVLLVESARILVEYLNGTRPTDEDFLVALLGEAESTLLSLGPNRLRPIVPPVVDEATLERYRAHVRELREQRESKADTRISAAAALPCSTAVVHPPIPTSPVDIDRELRRLCAELAARDLEMGHLARRLLRRRAWAIFGYASPAQYAKERVGVSLSSLQHRMTLARRLEAVPALEHALTEGRIGYEAAFLLSRSVGPQTVEAWLDRAQRRTIVHLREEVSAVEVMCRLEGAPGTPPDAALLARLHMFEEKVQSGEAYASLLGAGRPLSQISVTLDAGRGQRLRFKISPDLHRHWQFVRTLYDRVAPQGTSLLAFACLALWRSWIPHLERQESKWRDVHLRDRHRCTSPVCDRHDVTPHHLTFQAHGGTDDAENMSSLCSWCHIHGIHEGRIKAEPPSSNTRWTFGRTPILEVHGRERLPSP